MGRCTPCSVQRCDGVDDGGLWRWSAVLYCIWRCNRQRKKPPAGAAHLESRLQLSRTSYFFLGVNDGVVEPADGDNLAEDAASWA